LITFSDISGSLCARRHIKKYIINETCMQQKSGAVAELQGFSNKKFYTIEKKMYW